MVQFQNLDPFQHRAWRYLNVDETGIDDPPWNAAAGAVLRGLDEAIGLLIELADQRRRGDPGRQRPRLRPLPGPDPRQPDPGRRRASPGSRACRAGSAAGRAQAVDRLRLWGAKRDDPEARSSSFDLSVAAQFPFDWKRTLAFAPHQDTAAMIYLNSADRDAPGPRSQTLARSTTPAPPPATPSPRPGTPRPAWPLFPKIIATAEAYGIDPAREGYPDLIALPDEPYWVRTKLAPGTAWVEPDPNLPGTHRPEGIVALAGPGIARRTDPPRRPPRRRPDGPQPLRPADPRRTSRASRSPASARPPSPRSARTPLLRPSAARISRQFDYTPEEQAIIEQRLADLGYLE